MSAHSGSQTLVVGADQVASLSDVAFRLSRKLRKHSDTDLTMSQMSALTMLERHGTQRISDLARREQISRSSATRLVSNLERTGYVERLTDPDDGRSFLVTMTPHGQELLADGKQRANAFLATEIERLAPEDRAALMEALPALTRLINVHDRHV